MSMVLLGGVGRRCCWDVLFGGVVGRCCWEVLLVDGYTGR